MAAEKNPTPADPSEGLPADPSSLARIASVPDIAGIRVGHSTNADAGTGCTVIICPEGATGAVDVRGGAPATRETDLLRPEETVQDLHAVVLSGGSAFGLASTTGVADELERLGIGLDVGVARVPIVTGACLFDLACGDASVRPTHDDGVEAVRAAMGREPGRALERGNVGAGTGCTVGKLGDPALAMKSGLGEDVEVAGGLVCGAIAAVNACGDVVDPDTGTPIAGMRDATGGLCSAVDALLGMVATMPLERTNTTVSCVVTNARLTKAEATKVAQMAADAYAHAIRPTHTTNDGDTVFVMATGRVTAPVDVVGALATRALARAIADGARRAESAYGLIAARDL